MPNTNLGVNPVKQETDWYCGPAAAQMVLTFLGVAPPTGTGTWQDQLRTYIEQNTNARRPSRAVAPETPDNPYFAEQKCDRCDGEYECWATTPAVLKKLLNAKQSVTSYSISKSTTELGATDAMLDSIDKGRPAVALIDGSQHYVVIDGYRHDDPGFQTTYRRNLNGVWFCDPSDGLLYYKDLSVWIGTYLYWVECGTYADKIVVLKATR